MAHGGARRSPVQQVRKGLDFFVIESRVFRQDLESGAVTIDTLATRLERFARDVESLALDCKRELTLIGGNDAVTPVRSTAKLRLLVADEDTAPEDGEPGAAALAVAA